MLCHLSSRSSKATSTARQLVADPQLCAAQPALRAWAWNVLTGFPKADHDQTGDAPSFMDLLERTQSERVARIQNHIKRNRML